jgi:RND family efflux transporter MFP subunit
MVQTSFKAPESREQTVSPRKRFRTPVRLVLFVVIALLLVAILYYLFAVRRGQTPQKSAQPAEMAVNIVHPQKLSKAISIQVPGQLQAYHEAPIYAQTSGYLKAWYFDIGAKVRANDVLAEIDTPEVDQELAQAKAQLQAAQSALALAQVTYQRNQDLFQRRVISAQDFDTANDTYRQSQATVAADQANVDRLNALEAFKTVRAPFDGIVTARDTDVGNYIPSGSGTQLFRVARTAPLRIYVSVPQENAELVKPGIEGDLTLPGFPGRTFPAYVTTTAGAIDPTSRSLLTELEIPNTTGELLPGAYAQVTLKLHGNSRFVTIPINTLLFRREGTAVGVVNPSGAVEIRKITIDRNLGRTFEISSGLSPSDQVILNPSDGLADGMKVQLAPAKPQATLKPHG